MPKGPNGERRPADGIGCAISVAKIATGEESDDGYVSAGRRNSGLAGAKARNESLTKKRREDIAKAAAKARWNVKESAMSFTECFETAFEDGLADIKFFVRRGENVSVDELKRDATAFQLAIKNGDVKQVDSVD